MPVEPGNRDDEQMAFRHAYASGGDITENQHDDNRMRDIRIGKRGSEAASEEQPDMLRKTVRFEQEAPSATSSSDPAVPLEEPASGETQDRPGSVLVQKSGHFFHSCSDGVKRERHRPAPVGDRAAAGTDPVQTGLASVRKSH